MLRLPKRRSDDVKFLLELADHYIEKNIIENAICILLNVLSLRPKNIEVRKKLHKLTNMYYAYKAVGHSDPIFRAVWLSDGIHIASGGADNQIIVWNSTNGNIVRVFGNHSTHITTLAPHPRKLLLASGFDDGSIIIYDIPTCRKRILIGHKKKINALSWSGEGGKLLSCSDDGNVILWNAEENFQPMSLEGHTKPVLGIKWSPGGRYILSFSSDGVIYVWNPKNGRLIYMVRDPSGNTAAVDWSPNLRKIVSASFDGSIKILDIKSPRVKVLGRHNHAVTSIIWRKDGSIISAGWDGKVLLWDPLADGAPSTLGEHKAPIINAVINRGGRYLATSSLDREIMIWDLDSLKNVTSFKGHQHIISHISWSPVGLRLLSTSWDQKIIVWNLQRSMQERIIYTPIKRITSVYWRNDNNTVVVGFDDGELSIFDPETIEFKYKMRVHDGIISSLDQYDDKPLIATASIDSNIAIIDISRRPKITVRKPIATLGVNAVRFHPSGKYMLVATNEGVIKLLDMECNIIREYRGHIAIVSDVSWNREGTMFASASWDGTVRVWRKDSKSEALLIKYDEKITCVDWNQRIGYLAFGTDKGRIIIWSLVENRAYIDTRPHTNAVNQIRWSPDGVILASAGNDGTVFLYNIVRRQKLKYKLSSQATGLSWDFRMMHICVGCRNGDIVVVDSNPIRR